MPTTVQFRRGTTAQNNAFTGAAGEITVDTDKNTLIMHDGTTAGGHTLVNDENTNLWSDINNTDVDSAVETLDTWAVATYRTAKYVYAIENAAKTEYQAGEIIITHNDTASFLTEYAVVHTGNSHLMTFSTDVSAGNVNLKASAHEPNSSIRLKRLLIAVA